MIITFKTRSANGSKWVPVCIYHTPITISPCISLYNPYKVSQNHLIFRVCKMSPCSCFFEPYPATISLRFPLVFQSRQLVLRFHEPSFPKPMSSVSFQE
ncbi:hypothetical protein Hanom_Chr04g00333191 [Helianthus anomalus]